MQSQRESIWLESRGDSRRSLNISSPWENSRREMVPEKSVSKKANAERTVSELRRKRLMRLSITLRFKERSMRLVTRLRNACRNSSKEEGGEEAGSEGETEKRRGNGAEGVGRTRTRRSTRTR